MRISARGFTLVELLVVVTIIAVLSAIGLTVYASAQKSGRIAKRIEDLSAIRTSLEVYYSANKAYPATFTSGGTLSWKSECPGTGVSQVASSDLVVKDIDNVPTHALVPNYMVAFPADPSMPKSGQISASPCYTYASDGTDYKVVDKASEMSSDDFAKQRNLIDPKRDGSDEGTGTNCVVSITGSGVSAWAIYSSSASSCW